MEHVNNWSAFIDENPKLSLIRDTPNRRGQLMYLYRAVDGQGNTVEFCLSRTRGIAAAKAFFRKALKHHREAHSITLDGHQPSHSALRRMGMNGEFNFRARNPVKIRCCQYLNNVVEQDHRRVKGRLRPIDQRQIEFPQRQLEIPTQGIDKKEL